MQISLENIESVNENERKINYKIIEKYTSYLDWLELVYEYNKENGIENTLELYTHKKEKLLKELSREQHETVNMVAVIERKANEVGQKGNNKEKVRDENIDKLNWKYKYLASSKIPTKTSVTKLKQQGNQSEHDIEDILKAQEHDINVAGNIEPINYIPKFMEKEQKLTPTQRGTLIHLCVQRLDETKDYTIQDLIEFVQHLCERSIISDMEAKSIDINILFNYTKSPLWQELKYAREIHKEQPFYINIPAKEIYEEAEEKEKILVQGIIDLYYIDKDGKLVLIDYKTDKYGTSIELEEKYKLQLELYKRALEDATGKKVDRASVWPLR